MGLLANAKPNSSSTTTTTITHNRVMGLLLVFFPEDTTTTTTATIPNNKTRLISSSFFKRANSNALLSKTAQSTVSICALLLFTTIILFALSPAESTSNNYPLLPRRFLLPNPHHQKPLKFNQNASRGDRDRDPFALQGMGSLYRRGTKAMNDIIVGHVAEDTTEEDLRLFLRVLHRSGVTSKCDVVFVLASSSHIVPRFGAVVREENDSFLSLIELHSELNSTRWGKGSESRFDATRFIRVGKKNVEMEETVWGKRIRSNLSEPEAGEGELTRLSYGSVMSFDASELDPENSLAGFLDRVPLSLRRWACYPMLLGRVRRNFKHVMLVDVKNLVIFNDPFGRVRNRSADSVFLYANPKTGSSRHGKKNSARTGSLHPVNSAIVMGGARGVRRLSNAMLIEIVRAAMQHKKKKNSVSESAILSQLVLNEFALKNVDFVTPSESIPETSSLAAHNNSAGFKLFSDNSIIQRSTSNYDLNSVIRKEICSSVVDSSVYRDC